MSVPEFILKKLIVPDSFKTTALGFSFKILNSFASATITKFNIQVGASSVPPEMIRISSGQNQPFSGSAVTPQNPMLLSVGEEIIVEVRAPAGDDLVRLTAITKEVGEIGVIINSTTSRLKHDRLKSKPWSFLAAPKDVEMRIRLSEEVGSASPYLLGQFIEHLERCVYDGVWTIDGHGLRTDTLDLIRQLNPPMIRYPGGNFASGYHWEDGIGPLDKRPVRHDAAWQAEESNRVGTDEFLQFCEEIGSEPVLVVNDGSGTPEEAARWVSYCNSPADTEQGARRDLNGHPEPYNVKYWGLGNEVWGPWQIGTTSAEGYCKRAKRFIRQMREIDPSIKFIAVGHSPLTDEPDDEAFRWNEGILRELGDEIEYLSWHIYQPDREDWQEFYDPIELYHSVNAAHLDIEKIIARVDNQIQKASKCGQIQQAIDEWNLWLPPREKNVSMHRVTYTMRDALYASSVLMSFYKQCKLVGMANIAQLVNVLPLIETNENGAIATSMFYPFVLFRQMQPNVRTSIIVCESFDSVKQSINLSAHSNVPYIDGIASINPERTKLTILLINRYPFHRVNVTLSLDPTGYSLNPIHALQIHSRSPEDHNSFVKPNRIRISDADLPLRKGNSLGIKLKPCSVYFVEFEI